jgi:hypothetical protein
VKRRGVRVGCALAAEHVGSTSRAPCAVVGLAGRLRVGVAGSRVVERLRVGVAGRLRVVGVGRERSRVVRARAT